MRKFFNGLVMGIILSSAAFFFCGNKYLQDSEARLEHDAAVKAAAAAEAAATADPRQVKEDLLELHDDEIKAELKNSDEIIRRKPRDIGDAAANPDSDSRAMAEIKGKYQSDPKLSAWNISVNCAHGHVSLIGNVESLGQIGRAIAIALESGGVRDVTSTLQIKPTAQSVMAANMSTNQ